MCRYGLLLWRVRGAISQPLRWFWYMGWFTCGMRCNDNSRHCRVVSVGNYLRWREWVVSWGLSIFHRLVGSQVPCVTMRPLFSMYNLNLSKYAEHPWSHYCPIDNREPDASAGKMWAFLVFGGRWGMLSMAVHVDCVVSLFGRRTWIPVFVSVTCATGMGVWI